MKKIVFCLSLFFSMSLLSTGTSGLWCVLSCLDHISNVASKPFRCCKSWACLQRKETCDKYVIGCIHCCLYCGGCKKGKKVATPTGPSGMRWENSYNSDTNGYSSDDEDEDE